MELEMWMALPLPTPWSDSRSTSLATKAMGPRISTCVEMHEAIGL
jgi:hypothetical protein